MIAPASAVRHSLSAIAKTYAASLGVLLTGGAIAATIGYAVLSRFGSVMGTVAHLSDINPVILIPLAICAVTSLAVELRHASETR